MDEAEAVLTSKSSGVETECGKKVNEDVLSRPPEEPAKTEVVDEASAGRQSEAQEATTSQEVATVATDEEHIERVEPEVVHQPQENDSRWEASETSEHVMDEEQGNQTSKRPLEPEQPQPEDSSKEGPWKLATGKRHPRYHPAPRIPPAPRKPNNV